MSSELHRLARRGKNEELRQLLKSDPANIEIDGYDSHGRTPLMWAVLSEKADVETVRLLIASGADPNRVSSEPDAATSVISLAISGGDPEKVAALLEHGADIHYCWEHGYDALIDAAYSSNPKLLELLHLLISRGVALNSVTDYNESALRVLSRIGRFDAVRLLIEAGADESLLQWTPLIRAVALGTLKVVEQEIEASHSLDDTDYWHRTAWLVSIQTGEIEKAQLIRSRGANVNARGRCGKTALLFAIESHRTSMLEWLLQIGAAIEETDEFGTTPLMTAAEYANSEAVKLLLQAGASIDRENHGQTALSFADTGEIARILMNSGANPANLSYEARRSLVGLEAESDEDELIATSEEFRLGRNRRFGTQNPEEINSPFWCSMIRAGVTASQAREFYKAADNSSGSPIWSAHRFGQSISFLPNGDVVQVAGEHEDFYDEDFCIYNDVFVHSRDGGIRIFGYPESVFPPTDFHTATLIGEYIYLIGSLGYSGRRRYGTTPVYRLHTGTFKIEPLETTGAAPGWLYEHRAVLKNSDEIQVSGGKVVKNEGEGEVHLANLKTFILDTSLLLWRVV